MAPGKQRFPRWWQAIIIIVSGIVLGFSSCVGLFAATYGNRGAQPLPLLLTAGFFGGIFIAFAGCVLLVIVIARAVVNTFFRSDAGSATIQSRTAPGLAPSAGAPVALPADPQRVLRHLQITLIVMMLLPAGSVALSVLILMNRPNAWHSLFLIIVTYLLSQAPYILALARTRRGPDRLGIAIAFAASCAFFVEGLLPLSHAQGMLGFGRVPLLFFWPGLFLIGHIVVAVFAWRAGRLAPPREGDLGLIITSFAAVIIYLVVVRFLEVHFLPFLLR